MLKRTAITLLASGLLFGCNDDDATVDIPKQPEQPEQPQIPETPETRTTDVTIISANLWLSLSQNLSGGSDFHRAIEEFKHANADILLLSEASGITARIAEALNMYYWQGYDANTTTGIVSRYPIKSVLNAEKNTEAENNNTGGIGVVVDINGRDVVLWVNHLDYTHYHVYDARGGDGVTWQARNNCQPLSDSSELEALNQQSQRPAQAQFMLNQLTPYQTQQTATFIGGDFNEASGLDWTADTANMFDHRGTIHDFLTHRLIRNAGYVDSYRVLYPNPVTHPGITWPFHADDSWTRGTSYQTECGRGLDDRDRIDFIYHAPVDGVELLNASVIGPRPTTYFDSPHGEDNTYTWGDPHSGLMVNELGEPTYGERDFVSDHLWYKTTYRLKTTSEAPTSTSLDLNPAFSDVTLAADGDNLVISFTLGNWPLWDEALDYQLVIAGDSTSSRTLGWQNQPLSSQPDNTRMTVTVPPEVLAKLKQEAPLHHGLQLRTVARIHGWWKQFAVKTISIEEIEHVINIPDAAPSTQLAIADADHLDSGMPITLQWQNGTTHPSQWIAIYPEGQVSGASWGWVYARDDLSPADSLSLWQSVPAQGATEGNIQLPSLGTLLAQRGHTAQSGDRFQISLVATDSISDIQAFQIVTVK